MPTVSNKKLFFVFAAIESRVHEGILTAMNSVVIPGVEKQLERSLGRQDVDRRIYSKILTSWIF